MMQRLLLAQVLGEFSIIAIGGSQGAGKTTLLAKLYGLACDDMSWLNANEGRGEQLPVLILEDPDATAAQGYVRHLHFDADVKRCELRETRVGDVREFHSACGGANPDVLLPVLRVPQKFFGGTRQALMLLPGYERTTRENRLWQLLMRQVIIGSSGCVIVTDSTRLANQQQQEILVDTLQADLKTLDTLVVVTKTEDLASSAEKRRAMRVIAAQTFGIAEERMDSRVITAGVSDAAYVEQWLPELKAAIRQIGASTLEHRNAQLAHLEETVGTELGRVLATVQSRSRTYIARNTDDADSEQAMVNRCLETFDESSHALREDYRKKIDTMLRTRTGQAWDDLQTHLSNNHEGILPKLKGVFDTATESQKKLQSDIAAAWSKGEPIGTSFIQILGSLVEGRLGIDTVPVAVRLGANAAVPQRLGYADEKGEAVKCRKLSDSTVNDLQALFCQHEQDDTHRETSTALEASVKMLPALGLEYVRAASLLPDLVRLDEHRAKVTLNGDLISSLTNVSGQLQAFRSETSTILKGLAVVMAIDFFADGQLDSVAPLLQVLGLGGTQAASATAGGATAASGAATAMTAVSAIGAAVATAATVGFLVYAGMREVRQYDNQVRSYAYAALQGIQDLHQRYFMSHFDDLIAHLRERLTEGLRRRFKLDSVLMRQDRLAKSIADAKQYRLDLLDEIARSGRTLDIYRGMLSA
ncbi:hypothetical protein [Pararobbsia alpina]|uniref:hypothetical protein n=1 Tax=Pararobbsia alpina TaxID=621374 RepID=UPI001581FFD9|nr:hypothetical protein [Pararobbsia alpina]